MLHLAMLTFTWLAAAAVVAPWRFEGAYQLAASALVALTLQLMPLWILGWTDQLSLVPFLVTQGGLSALALVTGVGVLQRQRRGLTPIATAFTSPLTLFARSILDAWRARDPNLIGLMALPFIFVATAVLTYLAPSSSWDGLWYHDSIVGFVIQEQGFRWVDVPARVDYVNAYPKAFELLSLWHVLLGGREWMEIVPTLVFPLTALGAFRLMRNVGVERRYAMCLSLAFTLLPAIVLELRSTYLDGVFNTLVLVGLMFATASSFSAKHILLSLIAVTLAVAMKGSGLVIGPGMLLVLGIRTLTTLNRPRIAGYLGAWICGFGLLAGLGAPTYVRNWQRHNNPAWPLIVDIKPLGIHFAGVEDITARRPIERAVNRVLDLPVAGDDHHDSRNNGYGNILVYALPLLVLAGVFQTIVTLIRRRPEERDRRIHLAWIAVMALAFVPSAVTTLAWWWARYNLHLVFVGLLWFGWALSAPMFARVRSTLTVILLGSSIATLLFSSPGWNVPVKMLPVLLSESRAERATEQMTTWSPTKAVAAARDRELGEGDVIVMTGVFGFPASNWNTAMSNRVVFVRFTSKKQWLAEVEKLDPKWLAIGPRSIEDRAILSTHKYELVGPLSSDTVAYRRKTK